MSKQVGAATMTGVVLDWYDTGTISAAQALAIYEVLLRDVGTDAVKIRRCLATVAGLTSALESNSDRVSCAASRGQDPWDRPRGRAAAS